MTSPALALVIAALVLAFAFPNHQEAVLCWHCASVGIILSISVIVWCAVDLAECNTYQGQLLIDEYDDVSKSRRLRNFVC